MRSQSGEIQLQTLEFLLASSLFCMETRTAVALPGSPYVCNTVVMGIHVQSMSLASCAALCWKDKTELIVQQSTELRHSSSKIYRSVSHAQCKTRASFTRCCGTLPRCTPSGPTFCKTSGFETALSPMGEVKDKVGTT